MALAWLALALMAVQALLVGRGVDANAAAPQWLLLAIEICALAAVMRRARREPPPLPPLWRLLGAAMGLQLAWAAINLLAAAHDHLLAVVAVVFSGLYMIPCLLLITRSFDRSEPPAAAWLDLALSLVVALLLCALVFNLMGGRTGPTPASLRQLDLNANAVDFSLAAFASLRMLGAHSPSKRAFYYLASLFLWINAVDAAIYNHLELTGLPPWIAIVVGLAYVVLAFALACPLPAWLRGYRPPPRRQRIIAALAPAMLSLGVLLLAVSLARLNLLLGMVSAVLAAALYALRTALIQGRQQDAQRAVQLRNRRLQQQLQRDPLTGIANRNLLDARLRHAWRESAARGGECSLLMVDIDFFKQYNDSFGHLAGDDCLVMVAGILAANVDARRHLVARYGGEEFAIVLPDTSAEAASAIAARLLAAIERSRIAHPHGAGGWLGISIGAATLRCAEGGSPHTLVEHADRALYRAKRTGRNRCAAYPEPDAEPLRSPA